MDKPKIAGRPLTQRPTQKPIEDTDGPRHRPIESPERKPLDSSIADILREEAAREQEVRATEEARPKQVEKTGLSASERAAETRRRIAEMTGDAASTPAAVAAAATGAVAPGVNLRSMPDIDEINATLRARSEANSLSAEKEEQIVQRRGFRRGFFLMLLLLALLIAPYFFAEQITERLPQTEEAMAQYVQTVDQLRVWLNDQVEVAQSKIEELLAEDGDPNVPAADDETNGDVGAASE